MIWKLQGVGAGIGVVMRDLVYAGQSVLALDVVRAPRREAALCELRAAYVELRAVLARVERAERLLPAASIVHGR